MEERDKDKAVKEWLVQESGVQADELEWVTLWDNVGLTRTGFTPKPSWPHGFERKVATEEQIQKWRDYSNSRKDEDPIMTLGDIVKQDEATKNQSGPAISTSARARW